ACARPRGRLWRSESSRRGAEGCRPRQRGTVMRSRTPVRRRDGRTPNRTWRSVRAGPRTRSRRAAGAPHTPRRTSRWDGSRAGTANTSFVSPDLTLGRRSRRGWRNPDGDTTFSAHNGPTQPPGLARLHLDGFEVIPVLGGQGRAAADTRVSQRYCAT